MLPTAQAATFSITFFENTNRLANNNLFDDYTDVGGGPFEIADSAVTPDNLVMFSDPEFLSFEASLSVSTGNSTTFTLGIDNFAEGTTSERGILFDGSGNPFRFDNPVFFVSTGVSMCDQTGPTCSSGTSAWLALIDNNVFETVVLDNGDFAQLSDLQIIAPGTPYTPLGGTWSYQKNNSASSTGVYAFVSPVPVPAAFWLFGSALGLLGWKRRKAT